MKKILFIVIFMFFFFIAMAGIYGDELSKLENGVKVEENSELIYYLDVTYSGLNANGLTISKDIKGDYIVVEDKLPEGLIFNGFVETESGTIGAVNEEGNSCPGYVIDDSNEETLSNYHGLHYNELTRMITFKVRNLESGCKLTVGIKTITPSLLEGETRKDFYNTGSATESDVTNNSNTVHVWIGNRNETLYKVKYQYDSTAPSNAPIVPETKEYAENTVVGIEKEPILEGYKFTGWKPLAGSEIAINDGTFIMPANNVTLIGGFEKEETYRVQYQIKGTAPDNYVLPKDKKYAEGVMVKLDSLEIGTIIDGYRFMGWKTTDSNINEENYFEMPNHDVLIIGEFEEVAYKVEYRFQGVELPPNYEELLPETKTYRVGTKVSIADYPQAKGYRFLGWYKESAFIMPNEDVIIYGEWGIENGVFEPKITKEIINKVNYYKTGDIVTYKITVTNTAKYQIIDVMVRENNENAKFLADDKYELVTDRMVRIPSIEPNETVILYSKYTVTKEDKDTIINEVEIQGALADNHYNLNPNGDYKASESFEVYKEVIHVPSTLDNITKYIIMFIIGICSIVLCIIIYRRIKKS